MGLLDSPLISVGVRSLLAPGIFSSCSSVSRISHCSKEAKMFEIDPFPFAAGVTDGGGGVLFQDG